MGDESDEALSLEGEGAPDAAAAEREAIEALSNQLLTFLQNSRPTKVVIVDHANKKQPLALKTGRHRWGIATRVIMRQLEDVARVELLDKTGATFDVWVAPDVGDPEERAREAHQRKEAELRAELPDGLKGLVYLDKVVQHRVEAAREAERKALAEERALLMQLLKLSAGRLDGLERIFSQLLKQSYEVTLREAKLEGMIRSGAVKYANGESDDNADPAEALALQFFAKKLGVDLTGVPGVPQLPQSTQPQQPAAAPHVNGSVPKP